MTIRAEPGATVNVGGDKLPRQVYTVERRVLDAAIARQILVGQATELVAMIRREESGGLLAVLSLEEEVEAKEGVKSETFGLMFPVSADGSLQPAELFLRVVCPDFKPSKQEKRLKIPVTGDSAPVYFLLEAQRG